MEILGNDYIDVEKPFSLMIYCCLFFMMFLIAPAKLLVNYQYSDQMQTMIIRITMMVMIIVVVAINKYL